ncbi:MAG: ribonuclease R [Oceanococcus sp.]
MSSKITQDGVFSALRQAGLPLSFRALCEKLEIAEKADKRSTTSVLEDLVSQGRVLVNRQGDYALVEEMNLLRGVVIGHRDGYGFLKTEQAGPDWFLPPRQMDLVFPGDRVLARSAGRDRRGREKASVVDVLERNTVEMAGRFKCEADLAWIVPENPQIHHQVLIPKDHRGEAKDGDVVRVKILRQPDRNAQPLGAVQQVLGAELDVSTRTDIVVTDFGLPRAFPEAVEAEVKNLPRPQVDRHCRDARDIPFVTIDGIDAKDFDDAVFARSTPKGWRLWVAIADVSRYVRPGTALDQEAQARATSVYFPGRVIPMLPPVLSDDLCSLRPDQDRHALIAELVVGSDGHLRSSKFYPGLIRSRARLVYDDVAQMLEQDDHTHPQAESLFTLNELFEVLAQVRGQRGALDFEGREVFFDVGDDGFLHDIKPVTRNRAHKLIEECMILANVAAARYIRKRKLLALNRVHPPPPADTLQDFRRFLAEFGLSLGGRNKPGPEHYQAVLSEVADQPFAPLVQGALLRTLSQAVYSPESDGHFGLALDDYAHFTSPIRRYPDLNVHRTIKWALGVDAGGVEPGSEESLQDLGAHCSERERHAEQAGWAVVEALKCEFLESRVGEEFEGEIVGVTNFGLFVEIERVRASGLVHISSLGRDYFSHEPEYHRLRGERTGQVFRLGDRMRVRLSRVDAQERKIDFEPLAHKPLVADSRRTGKAERAKKTHEWREL